MKLVDFISESEQHRLDELDVGNAVAKGIGGVAKGVGALAGVPGGIAAAYKKGKAASKAAISGTPASSTPSGKVDSYGNPVSVNTDSDSPASTSALDKIKQLASELNDDDRAVAKSLFQQDGQSQQPTAAPATVASQTRSGKQATAAQAAQNQITPKPAATQTPDQIRAAKQATAATTAQQQMKANTAAPKTAAPQTPDQIRAAKQATAAQSAQAQMTPKPAVPQTQTPDQIRAAKQATAATTAQSQMTPKPAVPQTQTPDQIRAAKQATATQAAQAQMDTNPAAPAVKRNPNNPDDLGFGFDVDTGLPLKSQAEKDANIAKADAAEKAAAAAPATPARTGGKVAGQVSNTPNAVRKRAARAAGKAQPSAFGSMASQLTKNNAESYESTLASKIAEHKATNTVTESRSIFTK